MTLSQRQINHGIFGVVTVGGLLLWISALVSGFDPNATFEILIATILSGGLWIAYWRGWEHACHIVTLLLTLMVGVGIPDVTKQFDPLIFVPPLIALILTGPQWMLASAIATIGILLVRADGQGVYANTSNLIEYTVIIIGMAFSGLATDNARRLGEARAQAEQARVLAEQQAQELEKQASELTERNTAQQRLLDLVAELETPAVQLADGILFVPIVGHLDSRRAQALTGRLLEDAHAQRARLVILDIAGVSVVDTAVAQALLQTTHALRLLGCIVFLSGIAADVATTMVRLGIGLEEITTVRNPQDALARFAELGSLAPGRSLLGSRYVHERTVFPL